MRRPAILATALLLTALSVTACTSPTESYCQQLKGDQQHLLTLSQRSAAKGARGTRALGETVSLLDGLRDRAPDPVKADWDTLVGALGDLSDAITASGASPADFGSGRRPAGVTEGQLRAVQQAATQLSTTAVQQSATSIEQHAQDVCKVDLGAGLGGVGSAAGG